MGILGYIWNPSKCAYGDSVIVCDEIIEVTKTVPTETIPTKFNQNRVTCKIENLYILLIFLLTMISLLIIVSTYCYLIKDRLKQKHLSFCDTSKS